MRKGLLAKVHIGKADLGIANEEWRKMILEVSNNRTNSTKDLKMFELEELLRKLKGLGFMPTSSHPATEQQIKESAELIELESKLDALLNILHLPKSYAVAMAKNMFAISNLKYLQLWQLRKIVKTLENRKMRAKNEGWDGR